MMEVAESETQQPFLQLWPNHGYDWGSPGVEIEDRGTALHNAGLVGVCARCGWKPASLMYRIWMGYYQAKASAFGMRRA